jgi:uncharacterized repeat protein (TIGR01451 family)
MTLRFGVLARRLAASLAICVMLLAASGTLSAQALAPVIAKSFGAATIPLNVTTTLTIDITNPNNNVTLTNVDFTDSLPAGLVIATQGGVNTCGEPSGVYVFAQLGGSTISFHAAMLAPGAICTVVATVAGTTAGMKNNSVQGNSTNSGPSNTATASILITGIPGTPAPSSLLLLAMGLLALMCWSGLRKLRQRSL